MNWWKKHWSICDLLGLWPGENGDRSRFSATKLMMRLEDWISGSVGDVCVCLQFIC